MFRKLYEDNALGKLSDEQFAFLTSGYDEEKKTLTRRIAELSQEIDNATERSADVKRFVALVRKYTAITELTYENVHEFIDRILIHELDKETNTRKSKSFIALSAELIQATSLLKVSPIQTDWSRRKELCYLTYIKKR